MTACLKIGTASTKNQKKIMEAHGTDINGLSFFEYLIWDDIVIVKIRPTSIIPFSLVVTCARSSPENLRKISTTRFTRMHVSTLKLLVYMIVVKTIWQIIFHSYQFISFIPWTKIRQTSCHQMSPTSAPCEGSLQRGGLFFRAEETEGCAWNDSILQRSPNFE